MKQLTIDNLRKASNAITGERRLRSMEKETKDREFYEGMQRVIKATRNSGINLIREADENERW